jgi:hypothetical protein
MVRNSYAQSLGLTNFQYHKVPQYVQADGTKLTIEPERSIVVPDYKMLKGVKNVLEKTIPGFYIINKSDIGFRYPTAAIAGLEAPFIKRFRSEYFHNIGEDRRICRPLNLSYGIKSRGKGDNREEYEVWVPAEHLHLDPSSLFREKYGEELPNEVLNFASQPPIVHGWMGVKRSAFEAIYINKKNMGDVAIVIGLSVDAYNIGAQPDLSYSSRIGSSIARGNAELEWEVMGYYAPDGISVGHDEIWAAINYAIEAIGAPVSEKYNNVQLKTTESKTERILSTIKQQGISDEEVIDLNLKPWEFLETESLERRKAHDPSRPINLLGRLNRLFYQEDYKLPSLKEIHDLIAQ